MSGRGAQVDRPTEPVFNREEPNVQPGIANTEPGRMHRKPNAKEICVEVRLPIIQVADSKMSPANRHGAKKTPRSRQQIGPAANDGAPRGNVSETRNPEPRSRTFGDAFQRLTTTNAAH